ncbi:MAG: hypothetical protein FJ278_17125 [Planctomycetes bacterium]|nr:hypothetical protein [Planctomycetota bacterium]
MTEAEWCERLRQELAEATKLRLIADVPLGAFLSGGMDSSITVGLMSQAAREPVKTFSIGFEEKRYDELDYARLVAKRFQTDHREFIVRPDIADILPKLVWHYDEPFADSSAIPTYYLSKVTREHVKVALTGDAGDECFAGYPRYRAVKLAGQVDKLPRFVRRVFTPGLWGKLPASLEHRSFRRQLKRVAESLSLPPRQRYLEWVCIFNDTRKLWLYSDDMLAEFAQKPSLRFLDEHYNRWVEATRREQARRPDQDFLGQTTYVDLMTYLPNDILVKVDIASMAHALETRSPFLDYKVVELAAAMPTRLKMRGLSAKHILKKAFADLLPREILRRGKMGFGAPIAEWFRRELSDPVRDVLLSPTSLQRGYFRVEAVRQLLDDHIQGRADHGYRLWALFMLELWHRKFLDER